jgi:hypothetical protein
LELQALSPDRVSAATACTVGAVDVPTPSGLQRIRSGCHALDQPGYSGSFEAHGRTFRIVFIVESHAVRVGKSPVFRFEVLQRSPDAVQRASTSSVCSVFRLFALRLNPPARNR